MYGGSYMQCGGRRTMISSISLCISLLSSFLPPLSCTIIIESRRKKDRSSKSHRPNRLVSSQLISRKFNFAPKQKEKNTMEPPSINSRGAAVKGKKIKNTRRRTDEDEEKREAGWDETSTQILVAERIATN